MERIFTGSIIGKINRIFKKKGYDIGDALTKADELEVKELEYEEAISKIVEELKKVITSTEESEIEKLLRGIKDAESNTKVIKFLSALKRALRKIRYLLYLIKKFNDENVKVLESILTAIKNYEDEYHKVSSAFVKFKELCRERYNSRKKIDDFVVRVNESITQMLNLAESAAASAEAFDYENAIKCLQQEKAKLVSILTEEFKIYEMEVSSFKKSIESEQLKGILFEHYKSQLWENTKLIKRKYFLKRLRNIIIATFVGLHLAGATATTISISYPNIFKRYDTYHTELVAKHPHEEIVFKSRDGYGISGWFFKNASTDKTIILLHGRSANKSYEMPYVKDFAKHYNVLVFDFRGHGENPYGTTSFGFYEVQDLIGALDYLSLRGIKEVAILGHSMGGAVAIMTAAAYKPSNIKIKAIIVEGTFANLRDTLDLAASNIFLPPTISWPAKKISQYIAGYKIDEVAPEKFISSVRYPILILQGNKDKTIPADSAKRLYSNAKGTKELYYFSGTHNVPNSSVSRLSLQFLEKHF